MAGRLVFFALFVVTFGSSASAQPKAADLIRNESIMTYRLVHPLHKIEATSKDVDYKVQIDPVTKVIKSVTAQVDVTTFDSGNSSRDSHAMEVIDAISYPYASFDGNSISQNGDSLKIAGRITFHGVTRDVVIPAMARWEQNRLEVSGDFDLSLEAYHIERPSLLLIPVEDKLSFSFKAAFRLEEK